MSSPATVSSQQGMAVEVVGLIYFLLQDPRAVFPPERLVVVTARIPRIPVMLKLLGEKLCIGKFLAEVMSLAFEMLLSRGFLH